jgi:hypothetical protein
MKVLLPPSEGKSSPAQGEPVDLDSLAFGAELGSCRVALLGDAELRDAASIAREAGFEVELSDSGLDVIVTS